MVEKRVIKSWQWVVCTILYAIAFACFFVSYCDTGYKLFGMGVVGGSIWVIPTIILIEKGMLE